jgi:DNA-binding NarL/FixJ family response regulator
MATVDTIEDVLSEPQRAVLALSAAGLASDEVAAALQMPVHEVRAHLTSAMARLRARSRLEAVIVALRHGLVLPTYEEPASP